MVYSIGYLSPLAIVRIILLLLPLLYHSYSGTALKYPRFFQVFYWSTLVIVSIHMTALSFTNPQSLEAIVPIETFTAFGEDVMSIHRRSLLEHLHELRRVWWMLTMTMVSDICHLIMLWHVRSTAQSSSFLLNRKQPSIYFALRSSTVGPEAIDDGMQQGGRPSVHPATREQALVLAMNGTYTACDWNWVMNP